MTEDFQLRTDPRTAADMHRVMHSVVADYDVAPEFINISKLNRRFSYSKIDAALQRNRYNE